MDKLTISRILVENKYLLPVTKADTGVCVVDIPKAAEVLNELFQQKLKQCNVSGALPLAEIIGYLERLKHYLSSGSTYCFDNEHDLNDSEELEKFINSLRQ